MPGASAPHPLASLPRVDRALARFTRRVGAALAAAPPRTRALLDARWGALVGGPVAAVPSAPAPAARPSLDAAWARDRPLVAAWRHPALGVLLLAVPRDLAFVMATRALGPEAWRSPADPLPAAAEGALAALAARAAVTLTAPAAPPVLCAVTDHPADALAALDPAAALVAWDITLAGDALAGVVTLVLAGDALRAPDRPPPLDLARFAEAVVAVRCVGARATLTPAAVAALAPGDRLALDGLRWSGGALAGDVTLCLGADPPLRLDATIRDAARVTVAAPPRGPWSPAMNDPTEVLRDLRVEVTVELAAQTASLDAIASWGVGAVVEFPQRLGDAVVVRAGGLEVARGELVDVDGQVGVRITART